ncbi:MAG TPA: 50S ribosomal protein L5 [Caldithrix abyssi]|uniref:Large ribosomal subunit protein uL5 n=1 Tax=Caldithrix abyssi TaxID=187145 RepID=A0A7V5LJG5_CALAY|nr:50S ribosomal protein L5 [Caldisericaceae bacterium]HHE55722.1 50S ribosomal protein L5 [Caldithrix abyssi]
MADYYPRLLEKYQKEVVPHLMEKFGYKNINEVPKLVKISINAGVGEATQDPKALEGAIKDLMVITGQKPVVTKARKSVSNFKLRQGMKIGAKVTLRKWYMWEFLDRFISVAVPRIRDFRGFSDKSFDGRGNYSLGIKEQIIFPEINVDNIDKIRGFDITFVTTANTDEEGYELLKELGFPFRKK